MDSLLEKPERQNIRTFILKISKEFTLDEFEEYKFIWSEYIAGSKLDEITKFYRLVDELVKKEAKGLDYRWEALKPLYEIQDLGHYNALDKLKRRVNYELSKITSQQQQQQQIDSSSSAVEVSRQESGISSSSSVTSPSSALYEPSFIRSNSSPAVPCSQSADINNISSDRDHEDDNDEETEPFKLEATSPSAACKTEPGIDLDGSLDDLTLIATEFSKALNISTTSEISKDTNSIPSKESTRVKGKRSSDKGFDIDAGGIKSGFSKEKSGSPLSKYNKLEVKDENERKTDRDKKRLTHSVSQEEMKRNSYQRFVEENDLSMDGGGYDSLIYSEAARKSENKRSSIDPTAAQGPSGSGRLSSSSSSDGHNMTGLTHADSLTPHTHRKTGLTVNSDPLTADRHRLTVNSDPLSSDTHSVADSSEYSFRSDPYTHAEVSYPCSELTSEADSEFEDVSHWVDYPDVKKKRTSSAHRSIHSTDIDSGDESQRSKDKAEGRYQRRDVTGVDVSCSRDKSMKSLARVSSRGAASMSEPVRHFREDADLHGPPSAASSDKPVSSIEGIRRRFTQNRVEFRSCSKPIQLYSYQLELTQRGLEGKNCIICAPTGSGKTITAAYICQELRNKAKVKKPKQKFKALFVVCIRNLIQQQKDALCLLLKEQNVVSSINETCLLSEALENSDVVVLTAQILVNCLRDKEVNISDFDLIIMDECHHTNLNHPYNNVMKYYLECKWAGLEESRPVTLPQMIGLTASLGVGGASGAAEDIDVALGHYIKLCANLDCLEITSVKGKAEVKEMLELNPLPEKDQILSVSPRSKDDPFIRRLLWIMTAIEELCEPRLPAAPCERGSQQYENWAVRLRMDAEERGEEVRTRVMDALKQINCALMFYSDLTAKDALTHLEAQFNVDVYLSAEDPPAIRRHISSIYESQRVLLKDIANQEKISDNAKLQQLCDLLDALYDGQRDVRGIVLTRTRVNVDALLRFIKTHELLRSKVFPEKLVGQGSSNGLMTDTEQDYVLKKFRLGRTTIHQTSEGCNLLVATDVAQEGLDMPKCSFVIRYNFVSNEIGGVQSRGRARTRNSECYLIVERGSVNEKREYENLEKEHLMLVALEDIGKMEPAKLRRLIDTAQVQIREDHAVKQRQLLMKSDTCDSSQVQIFCRSCHVYLCRGSEIVCYNNNYVCTAQDFSVEKVTVKPIKLEFRNDVHVGLLYCVSPHCSQKLGVKIKYKRGRRSEGYSLAKDGVCWSKRGETNYRQIKKWSGVPFLIKTEALYEEMSAGDMD